MFPTRAPAAGRGSGRPPLGRRQGQVPVVDPRAADEIRADVVESFASGTGNDIARRHIP